jgi:rod shape-determining protein MreC
MRNLLRFIVRYHFIILFILFETIAFFLLFRYNTFHKAKIVTLTHSIRGGFSRAFINIKEYLSLREENKKLIEENNKLYNLLRSSYRITSFESFNVNDSVYKRKYIYTNAKVINNSTNKQYNYITLDKGKNHGIEQDMAVLSNDGIVGIVKDVTDNYSSVISLLNRNFKVNAKIKRTGYFGPLSWTGRGHSKAILTDIPHHVQILAGDTVVTSGYSAIFPEGYMIGITSDYKLKGGNYYEITVDLSTDFKNISNVQVVKNLYREEKIELEKFAESD